MANLTIDSALYITGVTGYLCTYDQFHQIVMRGDMCCTSVNRMAFYEYGDTLANCGGYRFHTGTTAQPLKFSVANDAAYFANNVGFGTLSPANALHVYRDAGTSATLALQVGGNYGYFFGNGCCLGLASDYGTTGIKFHVSRQAPDNAMLITSAGKVSVGSTSPNGQLSVAVDQSVNNQHFNIVGTQTSYSQEYSFGIPTSTKDLRIYDGTAGAVRWTLTCLGKIGIGTTSPTYTLQVNGSFYSAGSSCEYKTQICNYNTDSCMFMKLKPVTYQYKDEYFHLGKELKSGTQIGLIAEDTAEVFPELAILKEEENEKVVRNVDYEKLTIILLSELQKLRQEVDQLKNK